MKKSIKTKILTTILPITAGLITPVALLSAGCENPQIKKDFDKTKKELEDTKKKLNEANEKINDNKKELEDTKKKLNEANEKLKIDPKNDSKIEIEKSEHSFKNFNPEFTIEDKNITAYTIKDKKEVVYVDVDEITKKLEGYFDLNKFDSILDETKNKKIYRSIDNDKVLEQLIFDWDKNTIHITSTSFFWQIIKPEELTDGNQFLETEYEQKKLDDKGVTFELSKYEMDILYKDGKLLLPFTVFNTLFMSSNFTNLYFNGKTFTNIYAGIDTYGATPNDARKHARENSDLNGKTNQTKEQREINYNNLIFSMDYFYGLKEHKNIKSFDEYIDAEDKKNLLSTNPEEYNKAYVNLFHKKLNELHTRLNSFSYYESNWNKTIYETLKKPDDYSEYYNRFEKNRKMLIEKFEKKFSKKIDDFGPDDYIRYHGNTAIVTLLQFEDGTKEQINGPDAWKYDTYFLMRHLMKEIAKKPEIKNIVLDLAINGGGSVLSMIRTLGFMTDKPILNREYNTLDRRSDLSKSKVDTDGDGNYDGDAYENYNWSLLVSLNTFSAANQLTSIVKEMKIAKIIGKKTGGGMSAIVPIVLPDGTTVTISSPNNAVFGPNNEAIEDGVEPDINLEYEDFYNDEAIDKVLK